MMSDSIQNLYEVTQRRPTAIALGCAAVAGVAVLGIVSASHRVAGVHAPHFAQPPARLVSVVAANDSVALLRAGVFHDLATRSAGLCVDARPGQLVGVRRVGGQFDADAIGAFLRATHHQASRGKRGKAGPRVTLALIDLVADGVADDTPTAAAVAVAPPLGSTPAAGKGPATVEAPQAFETRLGPIKTGARAGVLNGQPAAALSVGLLQGPVAIDASGMSEVTNLSEPGVFRKTFKLSTRASIPLN